jgi:hypothetical protein
VRVRSPATAALCALSLLVAATPPAGAQNTAIPDSMWQEYVPRASAGDPAGAAAESWDRTAAVVAALVAAGLLGCALTVVLVARRRLAPAPAPVTALRVAEPVRGDRRWLPPEPVAARLAAPEEAPSAPAPVPRISRAPEPAARASGRYDELYDTVYRRELERIASRREKLRRRQERQEN